MVLNEAQFDTFNYYNRDYPNIKTIELRKMCLKPLIYNRISFSNLESLTVESPESHFSFMKIFSFLKCFKSSLKSLTLISFDPVDYNQLGLILDLLFVLTDLCLINIRRIPSDFLNAYESGLKVTVMGR